MLLIAAEESHQVVNGGYYNNEAERFHILWFGDAQWIEADTTTVWEK